MQPYIETERLILREILPTDADGLFELDSDPMVHRYLGNTPLTDKKQAEAVIAFIRQQYLDNGIGRWAMVERSSGRFIGWTGLKLVTEVINGQTRYYDLGYRLIREYWGRGLATESAVASLNYAFRTLSLDEVFAAAHIENAASNRILKKVGFEWTGTIDYDGEDHHWYRIGRNAWDTRK